MLLIWRFFRIDKTQNSLIISLSLNFASCEKCLEFCKRLEYRNISWVIWREDRTLYCILLKPLNFYWNDCLSMRRYCTVNLLKLCYLTTTSSKTKKSENITTAIVYWFIIFFDPLYQYESGHLPNAFNILSSMQQYLSETAFLITSLSYCFLSNKEK